MRYLTDPLSSTGWSGSSGWALSSSWFIFTFTFLARSDFFCFFLTTDFVFLVLPFCPSFDAFVCEFGECLSMESSMPNRNGFFSSVDLSFLLAESPSLSPWFSVLLDWSLLLASWSDKQQQKRWTHSLCTFCKEAYINKYAMQCNAMQCNAMQCNAMQCNAMQCNAMQCNAI